jgi:putative hydrolase of the HAD superfamily
MPNPQNNLSPSEAQQIKCILFDLGNVLVELDGFPWFQHSFPNLDLESIHKKWVKLDSVRQFETGKITQKEFFKKSLAELELDEELEHFANRYKHWVKGFYSGSEELLKNLKKNYTVACLSNTNSCHIDHLNQTGSFLSEFDYCFFSHEIGAIKPDAEAFEHACKKLNLKSESIFFVDDSETNVKAAIKCGMKAQQVIGFHELKGVLKPFLNHV